MKHYCNDQLEIPEHIGTEDTPTQLAPVPEHILAIDPTAYRALDGKICTKDPKKTVYYDMMMYLPKRLREKIRNGSANQATLNKANKTRIAYLLTKTEPGTKEFIELQDEQKNAHQHDADKHIQPGTIIAAATGLIQIAAILIFEETHPILNSKAMNFVSKTNIKG